jgi:hypothetical protein
MSDTIYSRPEETFYSALENAPTGLVGTVGVRILRKSDDSVVLARTTAGIVESPAGSGYYLFTGKAPSIKAAYTVLWDTGTVSPETTAADDLIVTAEVPEEGSGVGWEPSVAEVSSYIRARTKIPGGGIAGVFTEETTIKAREVEPLIAQAVRRVSSEIGAEPCTDELKIDARTAAAIYAAMLVEQSFFPEQTTAAGNSFASLEKLFKPQLQTLANRVERECGTGSGGEDGSEGATIARATFDDRRLLGPNGPVW